MSKYKPIGYFTSSLAAKAFESLYGSNLQRLSRTAKLAVLAILTRTAYGLAPIADGEDIEWSVESEISSGDYEYGPELEHQAFWDALLLFDKGSDHDALDFCSAILANL